MWTSNFVKSCTVAVESIKQQVAFFFRFFNNSMKNKIDHRLCLRSVAIELYYVMWNTWSDMVYVLPACMFFLPRICSSRKMIEPGTRMHERYMTTINCTHHSTYITRVLVLFLIRVFMCPLQTSRMYFVPPFGLFLLASSN